MAQIVPQCRTRVIEKPLTQKSVVRSERPRRMDDKEVLDIKARLARGYSVAQVAFDMKRCPDSIYKVKRDECNRVPLGAAAKAKKEKTADLKKQERKEKKAQKTAEAPPKPPRKRQHIEEHREVVFVMETYELPDLSEEATGDF